MPSSVLIFCAVLGTSFGLSKQRAKKACSYVPTIIKEAKKNNIEPSLLASVIMVESAYNPRAVSSASACGLTQVVPRWTGGPETGYKKYTCEQLKNPETSIRAGAKILSYNVKVYGKGNTRLGLCFYNAGTNCFNKRYANKLYYPKLVLRYKDILDEEGC
tara:strand:+ start:1289 stop:1768 length:480 start_codon:yes stop_codon:yes gene_type:complete